MEAICFPIMFSTRPKLLPHFHCFDVILMLTLRSEVAFPIRLKKEYIYTVSVAFTSLYQFLTMTQCSLTKRLFST